jgi:TolA-binding protein
MRETSSKLAGTIALAATAWLCTLAPTGAQEEENVDPAAAYDRAVRGIESGQFDDGLAAVESVLRQHGKDGMDRFGPVFGHFHYLKGILLIRKGEFAAAIAPLKTCFETFTNESLKVDSQDEAQTKLPNRFRVQAMAQCAGCHLMLKQYAEGALLYEQALKEKEIYDPKINRPQTQINLAICYLHQPEQMEKGRDFLLEQLRTGTWPESIKRNILVTLGNEWSEQATLEELTPLLIEQRSLIQRANLFDRVRKLNPSFINLAALGLQAGEPMRALAWYQHVASPDQAILEMQNQVQETKAADVAPVLEAERAQRVTQMEAEIAKTREQLAPVLLGMGAAHFQVGSYAASRAAHLRLEELGPDLEERPVVLHNLTVGAATMNDWTEVLDYGQRFFDEYPDHSLKSAVARLMVEVLFIQGNYAEAHDVAIEVRKNMEVGVEMRDIPDFVVGASAFHLDRHVEAELELEAYLKAYQPGKRVEPARFYQAAAKIKLLKWQEAADLFEAFLTDYGTSDLRPGALHFASLAHLVLGKLNQAEVRARELQENHPQADEVPASHNVLGDILAAQGASSEFVMEQYARARKLVEDDGRGDPEVAAYSLRQLITAASQDEDWPTAAGFYDAFREGYDETSWKTDACVAALDSLVNTERGEEALSLMEGLVNEVEDEASEALDQIFGSYFDFLKNAAPMPEVVGRLRSFPSEAATPSPALKSWLLTAEADALIDMDAEGNAKDIRQAMIGLTALYETHGTQLSNFSLVKLARWNVETWGKEEEARKIYDFILDERPFGQALGLALIERAKIDAAKKEPAARQAAMAGFQRALNEITEEEFLEEAVLGIGRLLSGDEKFAEAQPIWEDYLDHPTWTKARAEANYQYARCLDQSGQTKEAVTAYVAVYANFAGHLDWSTRAYLRTAVILKERGRTVDALKVLQDMLKRMGHHKHKGVETAKATFFKWRDEYAAEQQSKK